MDRNKLTAQIVGVARWLYTSAPMHSGDRHERMYIVDVWAETPDLCVDVRGVRIGRSYSFCANGTVNSGTDIKLVDYAVPASYSDCIPVTFSVAPGDPRFGTDGQEGVNMFFLGLYSAEKLTRMAANAQRILEAYGQL